MTPEAKIQETAKSIEAITKDGTVWVAYWQLVGAQCRIWKTGDTFKINVTKNRKNVTSRVCNSSEITATQYHELEARLNVAPVSRY